MRVFPTGSRSELQDDEAIFKASAWFYRADRALPAEMQGDVKTQACHGSALPAAPQAHDWGQKAHARQIGIEASTEFIFAAGILVLAPGSLAGLVPAATGPEPTARA